MEKLLRLLLLVTAAFLLSSCVTYKW